MVKMMKLMLGIGFGGFAGSIVRYLLTGFISRHTSISFPHGTLIVNVIGSLLLGMLMHLSLRTLLISDDLRLILSMGFLGALTTFSTFSYETFRLLGDGSWQLAFWNIGLNLIGCLIAVALGWSLIRLIIGGSS